MRATPALVAFVLLACTRADPPPPARKAPAAPPPAPAPVAFTHDGQTIRVPATWRDLEPEREAALLRSALDEAPRETITLEGKRHPDGLARGAVYLQTSRGPRDPTTRPRTVRELHERYIEDFNVRLADSGLEVTHQDIAIRGDHLEGTMHGRMQRDGRTIETRLRQRVVVPDRDTTLMHSVGCMADVWHVEEACAPILAAHTFDPAATLPLAEVLPANAVQRPLPGVGKRSVEGVTFGISHDQFAAACRRAGHRLNPADLAAEPEHIRTWFAERRMADCSGLPRSASGPHLDLGDVPRINAVFTDDHLSVLSIHLATELDVVAARLVEAYPDTSYDQGRVLHHIDDAATGDDLLRVGIDGSAAPGSRSALHFVSHRGANAPPVPIPEPTEPADAPTLVAPPAL